MSDNKKNGYSYYKKDQLLTLFKDNKILEIF